LEVEREFYLRSPLFIRFSFKKLTINNFYFLKYFEIFVKEQQEMGGVSGLFF